MTSFETIMIICAVLIVLLFGWLCVLTRNHYMLTQSREFTMQEFHRTLKHTNGLLSHIRAELGESIVTDVHIAKEHLLNIITNNREDFKSIQDILDKMHSNICADVAEKMVDRAFPIKEGEPLDKPFIPTGPTTCPPCYCGGPCTNPHHDCINCPMHNVSGGWTTITDTTLNKEGESKL